jgi:hypothetical protein
MKLVLKVLKNSKRSSCLFKKTTFHEPKFVAQTVLKWTNSWEGVRKYPRENDQKSWQVWDSVLNAEKVLRSALDAEKWAKIKYHSSFNGTCFLNLSLTYSWGGFFEQTPSWRPGASEITSPASGTQGRTQIGFFKDWKGELWGRRDREGDSQVKNA